MQIRSADAHASASPSRNVATDGEGVTCPARHSDAIRECLLDAYIRLEGHCLNGPRLSQAARLSASRLAHAFTSC